MGDLRDQLKKAKLLSDKKARQLAHEERVHRKTAGHAGLERQNAEREAELRRLREAERQQTMRAQAELDRARQTAAERAACEQILAADVVVPRGGGQRFYFEIDGGLLPWLELDAATARSLSAGELCIVRTGSPRSHAYGLLPIELGRRVAATFGERVVWAPRGVLS